jgi:hypothetical protein
MRLFTWLLAACVLVWAQAASAASITLSNNAFKLSGAAQLARLQPSDYPKIFKVGVDGPQFTAMAGAYRRDQDALVFTPAFPLTPGLSYRAEYRAGADAVSAKFALPKANLARTTLVTHISPAAAAVPENLLKIYVHFSAPMGKGDAYRHVHLIDQSGTEVNSVFLQVGQELWDPRQTRLTLLFDPGRIKRGLVSLAQLGMSLKAGRKYTLVVDADWPDANGVPLKAGMRKAFSVVPADRTALDPTSWKISAPKADTRQSVSLAFHESLDEVLLQDLLGVTDEKGKTVPGSVTVSKSGAQWSFVPAAPWQGGNYLIAVPSILEDLAGNKINSPFDVDVKTNPEQRMVFKTYTLKFTAR